MGIEVRSFIMFIVIGNKNGYSTNNVAYLDSEELGIFLPT
jgi:hypothetical protein